LIREQSTFGAKSLHSDLKGKGSSSGLSQLPVVTVIIPAYNEEKNIGSVLSETIAVMDYLCLPYEVIVVDDGSTDETKLVAYNFPVMILANEKNRGKGYCIRKGFEHSQGDIIVTMDSDGEHKPKEIPALIEPLFCGADVVAGSRFLGSHGHVTTRLNQMGNSMFNAAILSLTGKRVTDSQTGFRVMRRVVTKKFCLESDGYEIETEITMKSLKNGLVFQEKPISVERRNYGMSKLELLSDGIRIFKTLIKIRFT
jgi:glycosyltransferase involved in cell wall biosynthesis